MYRAHSVLALLTVLIPALGSAQISFPSTGYYVGMGDSVAAGTGALPATNGYVYLLYERGVFGRTVETKFSNASVRGARSWDLRDHQVPQVLCSEPAQRPTVVTITTGANDFFRGDVNVAAVAQRVADAVDLLLNNTTVLDPSTRSPCRPLEDATILVSNYYSIPHPDAVVFAQLEALLQGFDYFLRYYVGLITVPDGSRVEIVDLYTPSVGRVGLVEIERRLGLEGGDFHPTNLGHAFIAGEFAKVWRSLQE